MEPFGLSSSRLLRYFTFFYLYACQGIPAGFALTTIANYLVFHKVPTTQVSTFIGLVGFPWIIQVIWGPLIDRFQHSRVGHRNLWVILTQAGTTIASAGLLFITDPVSQLSLLTLLLFVHSILASMQDASVDALAIDIIPPHERGRTNAFMRGGFLAGIALGSSLLSYIMHRYSFQTAAATQTAILAGFAVLTLLILVRKRPGFKTTSEIISGTSSNPRLSWLFKKILAAFFQKQNLNYFLVIAAAYFCFSVFIRTFSFHLIDVLNWSDTSVSVLQGTWGSVFSFAAILTGGYFSDKIGHRHFQIIVMAVVGIFLIMLNSLSFLWPIKQFSGAGLVLWNLVDPLFSVATFPILMAACTGKAAGSQFTAYMAMINLCDVLGSYVSGYLFKEITAPLLGTACGAIILLLLFIFKKQTPPGINPSRAALPQVAPVGKNG